VPPVVHELAVQLTVTLLPDAETFGVLPAPRVFAWAALEPERVKAHAAAAPPGKAVATATRTRRAMRARTALRGASG
jgi:hypothetical protein